MRSPYIHWRSLIPLLHLLQFAAAQDACPNSAQSIASYVNSCPTDTDISTYNCICAGQFFTLYDNFISACSAYLPDTLIQQYRQLNENCNNRGSVPNVSVSSPAVNDSPSTIKPSSSAVNPTTTRTTVPAPSSLSNLAKQPVPSDKPLQKTTNATLSNDFGKAVSNVFADIGAGFSVASDEISATVTAGKVPYYNGGVQTFSGGTVCTGAKTGAVIAVWVGFDGSSTFKASMKAPGSTFGPASNVGDLYVSDYSNGVLLTFELPPNSCEVWYALDYSVPYQITVGANSNDQCLAGQTISVQSSSTAAPLPSNPKNSTTSAPTSSASNSTQVTPVANSTATTRGPSIDIVQGNGHKVVAREDANSSDAGCAFCVPSTFKLITLIIHIALTASAWIFSIVVKTKNDKNVLALTKLGTVDKTRLAKFKALTSISLFFGCVSLFCLVVGCYTYRAGTGVYGYVLMADGVVFLLHVVLAFLAFKRAKEFRSIMEISKHPAQPNLSWQPPPQQFPAQQQPQQQQLSAPQQPQQQQLPAQQQPQQQQFQQQQFQNMPPQPTTSWQPSPQQYPQPYPQQPQQPYVPNPQQPFIPNPHYQPHYQTQQWQPQPQQPIPNPQYAPPPSYIESSSSSSAHETSRPSSFLTSNMSSMASSAPLSSMRSEPMPVESATGYGDTKAVVELGGTQNGVKQSEKGGVLFPCEPAPPTQ
ncbi:hypothetical protein HDU97_010098 [Phlyctochytrium planicorne]|nr:hypothetical protein HDU97_010098 [Phlyctochytrium planicorne]